jgi:hypothetical protein
MTTRKLHQPRKSLIVGFGLGLQISKIIAVNFHLKNQNDFLPLKCQNTKWNQMELRASAASALETNLDADREMQ